MSAFFASQPVDVALVGGSVVALVSGVVGVFTVVRGQSFAGHALGDLGTLGGSGSFLVGISPLWGLTGVGAVVAAAMELAGVQRRRGRDVATGIVLGAALGISALLLYLDTTQRSTTGATVSVLFGSLFSVSPSLLPAMAGLAAAGVVAVSVMYRPLLLASVDAELARARGVAVRSVGVAFLVLLGVTVSLSSLIVGTILSPALLIGPAAVALRLARRPAAAMALAGLLGTVAVWIGVFLAWESYDWPPSHDGWPVGFFVVALVFCAYLGAEAVALVRRRA